MRRSALQLLLRVGNSGTSEQLTQNSQLTILQSCLLRAAGHTKSSLPSLLSEQEVGCASSVRFTSSESRVVLSENNGASDRGRRDFDDDGVGTPSSAIPYQPPKSRRRTNLHQPPAALLGNRTRLPGQPYSRGTQQRPPQTPSPASADPAFAATSPASQTSTNTTYQASLIEPALTPSEHAPSSPVPIHPSQTPPSQTEPQSPTPSSNHVHTPPQPATVHATNSQLPQPQSRHQYATKRPRTSSPLSLNGLLATLRAGQPPPPPAELLVHLTKGSITVSPETLMARQQLEPLLLPYLKGDYGRTLTAPQVAKLLWASVKLEHIFPSTLAVVDLLVQAVRPDMPYNETEYWATLALWSLGRTAQTAARSGTAGGSGGGGGGRFNRRGRMVDVTGGGMAEAGLGLSAGGGAALLDRATQPNGLLHALCELLRRNVQSLGVQPVANFFWAAGHLKIRDLDVLRAVGGQAARLVGELNSQGVANVVYGCALLDLDRRSLASLQSSVPFMEVLLTEAVRRRLRGFHTQEVASLVWSSGKMDLPNTSLLEAAVDFMSDPENSAKAGPQEWSNIMYGMTLKKFYDSRLYDTLASVIAPSSTSTSTSTSPTPTPTFSPLLAAARPQACSNLLHALGGCHHLHEGCVDALLARLAAWGSAVAGMDVVLALRACANLGYVSPNIGGMLERCMRRLELDAPILAAHNALWSLMVLDLLTPPHMQHVVTFLVRTVNTHALGWAPARWRALQEWYDDRRQRSQPREGAEEEGEPQGPGSAGGRGRGPPLDADEMVDLSQLVQYHYESLACDFTGPAYRLELPVPLETIIAAVRHHRQEIGEMQRQLYIQNRVLRTVKELANTGVGPILHVESEVLMQDALCVDLLVYVERPAATAARRGLGGLGGSGGGEGGGVDPGNLFVGGGEGLRAESDLAVADSLDGELEDSRSGGSNSSSRSSIDGNGAVGSAAAAVSVDTSVFSSSSSTSSSSKSGSSGGGCSDEGPPTQQIQQADSSVILSTATATITETTTPAQLSPSLSSPSSSPMLPPHLDPARCYVVAVEVDGPMHFLRNRPGRYEGTTAYRNRTLARLLGGPANVILVSTRLWAEELVGLQEQRRWMLERLRKTVAPPLAGVVEKPQEGWR